MWSWLADWLLPLLPSALLVVVTWTAYRRLRLNDLKQTAAHHLFHLFQYNIFNVQDIRIPGIPPKTGYVVSVVEAWWKRESVLAMSTATYDIRDKANPQVFDVTYEWAVAPSASAMYERAAKGSQILKQHVGEEYLHTFNWQNDKYGYVVWVRTHFAGKRSYLMKETAHRVSASARDEFYRALDAFRASKTDTPVTRNDVSNFAVSKVDGANATLRHAKGQFRCAPRGPGTRIDRKVEVCVQRARLRTFKQCRREAVKTTPRRSEAHRAG